MTGLVGTSPTLLTVGPLGTDAGVETVLHAMTLLRVEHPDLTYVVAGEVASGRDGDRYRQCIEALADDLGLGPRVTFLDRDPDRAELLALVVGADILVVPSKRIGASTYAALGTAKSSGRPIVAVRHPVTASVLATGGGVLVTANHDEQFAEAVHAFLATRLDDVLAG